jgi:hypothetical protein
MYANITCSKEKRDIENRPGVIDNGKDDPRDHGHYSKAEPGTSSTSSANGIPNVALVGFLKVMDPETIMISDNFFLKTEDNLKHNPKIAFVVYDSYTGNVSR